MKKEMGRKFISQEDFKDKMEEAMQKVNSIFGKTEIMELMEGVDAKIQEIKNDMKEFEYTLEDVSDKQAKQKRLLEGKLDAVYFDEELDEMKQLITMLSEMSTDTNNNQIQQHIQESKKRKKETGGGGGMKLNDSQRHELENILADFPGVVAK